VGHIGVRWAGWGGEGVEVERCGGERFRGEHCTPHSPLHNKCIVDHCMCILNWHVEWSSAGCFTARCVEQILFHSAQRHASLCRTCCAESNRAWVDSIASALRPGRPEILDWPGMYHREVGPGVCSRVLITIARAPSAFFQHHRTRWRQWTLPIWSLRFADHPERFRWGECFLAAGEILELQMESASQLCVSTLFNSQHVQTTDFIRSHFGPDF
jgi:hypothetical protein